MVQSDIGELKQQQEWLSNKVRAIERSTNNIKRKGSKNSRDIADISATNLKMIQTVIHSEQEICAVKQNVEKCESWLYKGMMMLTGVDEKDEVEGPDQEIEEEDVKQTVYDFMSQKLGIDFDIEVTFAFRMGKRHGEKTRPILFKLLDSNNSKYLYANVSQLKDQWNS